MVVPLTWRSIGAVDPRQLCEAQHQVHSAAQWLVRMAHSYMEPKPEHRHTFLHWESPRQALVTQEFLPQLTLELRIPNLALQFRENDQAVPHVMQIDDRTPAEVEAWVLVELLHRGIDRDRFSKVLPYELLDLMTGDAVPYAAETLAIELGELGAWFANAASVLSRIEEEYHPSAQPGGSAVWCRPEFLDLAILLPMGAEGASLRIGFSAAADYCCEPHFYVVSNNAKAGAVPLPEGVLAAANVLQEGRLAEGALDHLRRAIAVYRSRVVS
jgi:hypothetical protein